MTRISLAAALWLTLVTAGFGANNAVDITPGEDLAGWVIEGTKFRDEAKTKPVWTVKDGVVHCAGSGFGFLRFAKKTDDFVLSAEYRMSRGCNSGLGIRTVPFTGPAETRPSFASYEIQILDDAGKPTGDHASMSLYRYLPAKVNAVKPAGEWNQLTVTCKGPRIRIELNGQTVQDVDQSQFDALKDKPLSGYISLQNHGRDIDWRGLRLQVLAAEDAATQAANAQTPETRANAEVEADAEQLKRTMLSVNLRSRKRASDNEAWQETNESKQLLAAETAIVLCDVWDKHWCAAATARCDVLAKKMAPLVDRAREHGVHIIHCPSDTLDFYKDHPARQVALMTQSVEPPLTIQDWCYLNLKDEEELPIDDSDGGCDSENAMEYKAWTRQHPAIQIADTDVISESGEEVYSYLRQHGIKNVLYVGVHTNMCVLGRSFGIRQMTRLGFNTILVRDLTDTMYNPKKRPFVSHDEGTELVVQHVEKFWCPTMLSEDFAKFEVAPPAASGN